MAVGALPSVTYTSPNAPNIVHKSDRMGVRRDKPDLRRKSR